MNFLQQSDLDWSVVDFKSIIMKRNFLERVTWNALVSFSSHSSGVSLHQRSDLE